jgi:hypothetical protein
MTMSFSGWHAARRPRSRALLLRPARLLASTVIALGCTPSADAANDSDDKTTTDFVATAAEPVALSTFKEATYTALVADRAGALHAVWLDRNPESQRQAVYYRASPDGGRTWGDPAFLSEGQPDGYTGIPTVVADGAGRVYAVWKMVDRGTSMAETELRSRPAYGTLVYRTLENGRWSPVRTIGAERAVVAWFAATDPRGRTHVLWSENPDGAGFMSTTADARVVRQAQLDGATPRGGRVISGPSSYDKLGYWTLSGFVDAEGTAHWVAVRGSDAERRSVLVHSNGGRERMLPYYSSAAASDMGARTPPQLVADASGQERVVLYEGGARPKLVDHSIAVERSPVVLATGTDADAIQDFQISTAGGRIVATMQVTGADGNRLADLYVSTLNGDAWTTPARVTDNASRTRAQGVTDAQARSLGTVKVHSAIHASVVPSRAGLHVLYTSRETSRHVDTRAGGMSGASARSRAWFTTVPITLGAAPAATRQPDRAQADDEPTPAVAARRVGAPGATSAAQQFARHDVNEDGWLSGTELSACGCRNADADGDGEVTKAEFVGAAARGRGTASRDVAGGTARADATGEAERLFAQYDITEGGWLSGTELNACKCRGDDTNGDGEVTKAEFVAGFLRRGGAPAPASVQRTTPVRPAPPAVSTTDQPNAGTAPARGGAAALPMGKYNCYANGAGRPMPWEPGFGGIAEAPRATTQYLMNLTVGESGSYQYLNRGRGSYRLDGRTGMIDWLSGPFAGSGIRAAYGKRSDGRPVIYLDLEGTRAHCVGPQA